jgi:hypothetical protein
MEGQEGEGEGQENVKTWTMEGILRVDRGKWGDACLRSNAQALTVQGLCCYDAFNVPGAVNRR